MTYSVHKCTPHFIKELKMLFPEKTKSQLEQINTVITFQPLKFITEKKTDQSENLKQQKLEYVIIIDVFNSIVY